MALEKIEIIGEISFNDLCSRLRKVTLRGFPNVKIYEKARINIKNVSREDIKRRVFTPQPTVYQDHLERINLMRELFLKKGIDMYNLNGGYDYIATDSDGNESEWTLIPPVVETIRINYNGLGLNYSEFLGEELKKLMQEGGHALNSNLNYLSFQELSGRKSVPQICDGSHRIHAGVLENVNQNILLIENITFGFPYYAAPQPYNIVRVIPTRNEIELKVHILTDPAHKLLYRVFPTGGIKSGNLRPPKEKSFI
ncbi:MAG: hypothetical protein WC584_04005 [Candidatus Pacearchaeota archaeon]